VHQLFASDAGNERPNDVRVHDIRELSALLGEMPDEVLERLVRLLTATPEIPRVPRAYVYALEVPDKDLD